MLWRGDGHAARYTVDGFRGAWGGSAIRYSTHARYLGTWRTLALYRSAHPRPLPWVKYACHERSGGLGGERTNRFRWQWSPQLWTSPSDAQGFCRTSQRRQNRRLAGLVAF